MSYNLEKHAMRHGRLDWPRPSELTPAAREVYDRIVGGPRASAAPAFQLADDEGRLQGPFNAMLVNPRVGDAVQALGAAIRYATDLRDREREIAILALAVARRSAFEWYAHERVGLRAGLSEDEVEALGEGRAAETFSPSERVVHATVVTLTRDGELGEEEYTAAVTALGLPKLADLVALVGYYDLLALSLRVWRTPLPAGEVPRFGENGDQDNRPPSTRST